MSGFSLEESSNLLEKTLKNVESLMPNKCDNIMNRYKQQLEEIEKYENLMKSILETYNKEKENLNELETAHNQLKRRVIEADNEKELKQQSCQKLYDGILTTRTECVRLRKQYEMLSEEYKQQLSMADEYKSKMKQHEDNYKNYQEKYIDSCDELKHFKLMIEELKAKKEDLTSKIPENLLKMSENDINKEMELLKSKLILLESLNFDLNAEIQNKNEYSSEQQLNFSQNENLLIQKKYELREQLKRKLKIKEKRLAIEKSINELQKELDKLDEEKIQY